MWAFLLPIIILGGIFGGVVTATEGAALAVVAALFVGLFIYRELHIEHPVVDLRVFKLRNSIAETLAPVHSLQDGPVRLLVAAKLGNTRLIDNVAVPLRSS